MATDPQHASGFPPIENPAARVLILGSMPGIASLRAGQYYGHPRNQFWPLLGDLLNRDFAALAYPARLQALRTAGIALWDVLRSCSRQGSLDADIAADSIVVNDFVPFFERHPGIGHVCCNGSTAERLFIKWVQPRLGARAPHIWRLPSTSPAHAALNYQAKLERWRAVLLPLLRS